MATFIRSLLTRLSPPDPPLTQRNWLKCNDDTAEAVLKHVQSDAHRHAEVKVLDVTDIDAAIPRIYDVVDLLDGPIFVIAAHAKLDADELEWLLRQKKVLSVENMHVDEKIAHELQRRLDPKTYNKLVWTGNEPLAARMTELAVEFFVCQCGAIQRNEWDNSLPG